MRRRELVTAERLGSPPPELELGRCVEIWAGGPSELADWTPALKAFRRWSHGFSAYCDEQDIERGRTRVLARNALKVGSPWSIAFMIANGKADQVEARFRAATVAMSDIPSLQRAAQRWVDKWETRND